MNFPAEAVVRDTRNWLERVVIGLNLCPFAKAVHAKRQVHYAVSQATDGTRVLDDLAVELESLVQADPAVRETTLLIVPGCLDDFLEFNALMGQAQRQLRRSGLEGTVQLASFHPRYQFADAGAEDMGNYTNRSPYPTIHLLREASIERAVESMARPEVIYESNVRTLENLGLQGWLALRVGRS